MTPDNMIRLALIDGYNGPSYSQELYSAFRNGFPLENLRRLLVSDLDRARGLGAYLVYELGWLAHPLVQEIGELLQDSEPQVRSDAVYALTDCTHRYDGKILGQLLLLLDDSDPFVHRSVINFVRYAEIWQLNLAINEAALVRPDSAFDTVIKANCGRRSIVSRSLLKFLVSHQEPVVRRFGAGMAGRPRPIIDDNFLDIAEECNDNEGLRVINRLREFKTPTYAIQTRLNDNEPLVSASRGGAGSNGSEVGNLELLNCRDHVCLDNPENCIRALVNLDKGVFHPVRTVIKVDADRFSSIYVAWMEHADESVTSHRYVDIIFQDVREFEFAHASYNLDCL